MRRQPVLVCPQSNWQSHPVVARKRNVRGSCWSESNSTKHLDHWDRLEPTLVMRHHKKLDSVALEKKPTTCAKCQSDMNTCLCLIVDGEARLSSVSMAAAGHPHGCVLRAKPPSVWNCSCWCVKRELLTTSNSRGVDVWEIVMQRGSGCKSA